jgi:hypothetical protein
MSQKIVVLALSLAALADLTANTFVDATGDVATAGGNALGVVGADTQEGDMAPVDVLGTTTVIASGVIDAGEGIEVGADGKAAALDDGKAVARCCPWNAAAADGDLIEIFLIPN